MITLKQVVAEQVSRMRMAGLKGAPFVPDSDAEMLMLEVWYDCLVDAGYGDKHAPVIAMSWRSMTNSAVNWFQPSQLRMNVRSSLPKNDFNALPDMSDDQRRKNLKRLGSMMREAFSQKLINK